MKDFSRLDRKAIRIVQYEGTNKIKTLKEISNSRGYGIEFEELINYINALLPSKEIIEGALRTTWTAYPPLAIREAVANALIHQDFSVSGTGPTVEIFSNRIEITNAGEPLVDINRIIDNPPRSRNEKLAELMRRLKICEELGTGWDKIVISCELQQLPAPKIEVLENSTRVTLYSERPFKDISHTERIWACYLHACIKYVQGEYLTNSSLRERFGVKDSASGNISRLIKEKETRKQKAEQEGQKQYGRYLIPAYRADVFLQSFPNTAGLHQAAGVVSGQAFTDYYITVIYEENTKIYGVFQGDQPVYKITNPTEQFLEDVKSHKMKNIEEAKKAYYKVRLRL